jgi:hypothetical protein
MKLPSSPLRRSISEAKKTNAVAKRQKHTCAPECASTPAMLRVSACFFQDGCDHMSSPHHAVVFGQHILEMHALFYSQKAAGANACCFLVDIG